MFCTFHNISSYLNVQRKHGRRNGPKIWRLHSDRSRVLPFLPHSLQPGYEEGSCCSPQEWGGGDGIMITQSLLKVDAQAGTIYDQNHNDNHRNSMASQSLLLELEEGDRVQVRPIFLVLTIRFNSKNKQIWWYFCRLTVTYHLPRCMCTRSLGSTTREQTISLSSWDSCSGQKLLLFQP